MNGGRSEERHDTDRGCGREQHIDRNLPVEHNVTAILPGNPVGGTQIGSVYAERRIYPEDGAVLA